MRLRVHVCGLKVLNLSFKLWGVYLLEQKAPGLAACAVGTADMCVHTLKM